MVEKTCDTCGDGAKKEFKVFAWSQRQNGTQRTGTSKTVETTHTAPILMASTYNIENSTKMRLLYWVPAETPPHLIPCSAYDFSKRKT